ncbi:hypothetical protein X777_01865 [Ooceraea biroi]|uniref:Uncharacterized protein n=1 Tax=Ooceraea biroi TaxID=2015173 RepID=A0A026WQ28_OOCBI|nr:hypothetical protein X777_01865 [Ooceraea biroi]
MDDSDEEKEEEQLSSDSDYHSEDGARTQIYTRIFPNPQLLALTQDTVMCMIEFYYELRDDTRVCSFCIIRVVGVDLWLVKSVRLHTRSIPPIIWTYLHQLSGTDVRYISVQHVPPVHDDLFLPDRR